VITHALGWVGLFMMLAGAVVMSAQLARRGRRRYSATHDGSEGWVSDAVKARRVRAAQEDAMWEAIAERDRREQRRWEGHKLT